MMTIASRWPCRVCWKSNHPDADRCWQCKAPRDVDEAGIAAHKAEIERRAALPERVPDVVVALPVVIFRSYARVWLRGGLGSLVVPLLLGFAGLTDVSILLLTGGLAVGLVGCGFLAGEVAEGMAAREAWAFVLGILLAIVGAVGSVMAVDFLAPGLFDPGAVRWGSVIVFGGAGIAAATGLAFLVVRRET